MRYETLQVIPIQEKFEIDDLPGCLAPSFKQESNKKLNNGWYQHLKTFIMVV